MTIPCMYLASASPRRKQLLEQLGFRFNILLVDIEEKKETNEKAADYVRRLSIEKSQTGVKVAQENLPVLGADTIVVCDDHILEKPTNFDDAKRMLEMLSGRSHQVMTAITFSNRSRHLTKLITTDVWFKPLTEIEIKNYWQTGEPQDKAGSYAIQGIAGRFVTRLEGSYSGVVGLPLYETDDLFKEFQLLCGDDL